MNLKALLEKRKAAKDIDVNILPVMNIFLLLIPFLLLTAVFVRLAVIELSLPTLGKGEGPPQYDQEKLVLIILAVRENGFQLKSLGFKFDPIDNINGQYNYSTLANQLKEIKLQHPQAEDIIISPEARVKYDIIIKVMDRCRESGFPNVSLSG
ncbi:MAG: biopolymer transporter ExbD [candidate division KSB1 bacterium]|nr:biopolymer transporter ExbD [candidate division KSB1 bacterium]